MTIKKINFKDKILVNHILIWVFLNRRLKIYQKFIKQINQKKSNKIRNLIHNKSPYKSNLINSHYKISQK